MITNKDLIPKSKIEVNILNNDLLKMISPIYDSAHINISKSIDDDSKHVVPNTNTVENLSL